MFYLLRQEKSTFYHAHGIAKNQGSSWKGTML